jgi:hypothetical protein
MPVNYVTDNNGDTIAVQIPIEEWNELTEKYPEIEISQRPFDVPQWQKDEVLKRKLHYEDNPGELLIWEEAAKRSMKQ